MASGMPQSSPGTERKSRVFGSVADDYARHILLNRPHASKELVSQVVDSYLKH